MFVLNIENLSGCCKMLYEEIYDATKIETSSVNIGIIINSVMY